MHTQLPQQQLHCFPTGQLSGADGLHSLTGGIGVAVGVVAPAVEINGSTIASTSTDVVRMVTTSSWYSTDSMAYQRGRG